MTMIKIFFPIWMRVILAIGNEEGIYARRIGALTDISPPTINFATKKMKEIGMLRYEHKESKRIKNYYLTELGRKIYDTLTLVEQEIRKIKE